MRPALALVAVIVIGCSDSGGDLAIDDLDNALLSKYCDVYVRCGLFTDHDGCVTTLGSELAFDPSLAGAVKAGKVTYHGDKARACIDSFDPGTCDRKAFLGALDLDNSACDSLIEGTVHADGACAIDEECISQTCDVPTCSQACCMGTCVGDAKPERGGVGTTCDTTSDCDSGTFCDTTTMMCAAPLENGATCTASSQCESYYCMGTCQAAVDEGGACVSSAQCRLLQDNCNSQKICSAGVADGQACGADSDCKLTAYCAAAGKTCTPRPVLGESCADVGSCIDGSRCDQTSEMCVALVGAGGACKVGSDCQSRECDTSGGAGICQAQLACY